MFKLTIELEGREFLFVIDKAEDVATVKSNLKDELVAERGWFSFSAKDNGWFIFSSDQLRKAFIKMEDLK